MDELENPQGQTQNIRTYIQVIRTSEVKIPENGCRSASSNKIHNKFQAVGAICRQAGHRFGDHVERVVPLVLQYAKMEDEELREQCLQVCREEHFQEIPRLRKVESVN